MGNDIIKQEAVTNLARTLDVDNVSMLNMLAKTACKDIQNDDEMLAFVIICANYQLNPLVKEIYAFKNSFGAIVPVVGVDGWLAIANRNPQFDGVQCEAIFDNDKVAAIKCTIWRKDRSHPAIHTEYMRACKGTSKPWVSHPERMLEWKAIIQTIRIAFSISGIYDPDEAERRGCSTCRTFDHRVSETSPLTGRQCYEMWKAKDDARWKAKEDARTPEEREAREIFLKGLRELY